MTVCLSVFSVWLSVCLSVFLSFCLNSEHFSEKKEVKDVVLEAPAVEENENKLIEKKVKIEEKDDGALKKDREIVEPQIKKDEKVLEPKRKEVHPDPKKMDEKVKEKMAVDVGKEDSKEEIVDKDKKVDKLEEKKEAEEQKFAILPPKEASGPGEGGKPYKESPEIKYFFNPI